MAVHTNLRLIVHFPRNMQSCWLQILALLEHVHQLPFTASSELQHQDRGAMASQHSCEHQGRGIGDAAVVAERSETNIDYLTSAST
jgi:hypothetical protein